MWELGDDWKHTDQSICICYYSSLTPNLGLDNYLGDWRSHASPTEEKATFMHQSTATVSTGLHIFTGVSL